MTTKLLIVTDLGLLKAYALTIASRSSLCLDRIKTEVLDEANNCIVEKAVNLAGRRITPMRNDWSAPVANAHKLKLETKRRLVKRIAELVEELIQKSSESGVWLAAPQEINGLLTAALLKCVRQRIEVNLALNLVHADEKELLEYFALPAFINPH